MSVDVAPPLADGKLRLVKVLGEGGVGKVYLAFNERLGVYRAVKVLDVERTRSATLRVRFETEARIQARLRHPNIVQVYDIAEDGDRVYFVMEWVQGGSLWDILQERGPLAPRLASRLTLGILNALEVAHDEEIIHRDVKPHNVLLSLGGTPKVADFGVAHLQVPETDSITRTGVVMGTWAFMAPEQRASSRRVTPGSDLYATGATLYTLLTGRTDTNLFDYDATDRALDLVHPALRPIIHRATRYDQGQRYTTAAEMKQDLQRAMVGIDATPADSLELAPRVTLPPLVSSPGRGTLVPGPADVLASGFSSDLAPEPEGPTSPDVLGGVAPAATQSESSTPPNTFVLAADTMDEGSPLPRLDLSLSEQGGADVFIPISGSADDSAELRLDLGDSRMDMTGEGRGVAVSGMSDDTVGDWKKPFPWGKVLAVLLVLLLIGALGARLLSEPEPTEPPPATPTASVASPAVTPAPVLDPPVTPTPAVATPAATAPKTTTPEAATPKTATPKTATPKTEAPAKPPPTTSTPKSAGSEAPAPVAAPTVTPEVGEGVADAVGDWDSAADNQRREEAFRNVVTAKRGDQLACHAARMEKNPQLKGNLVIKVGLEAGAVASTAVIIDTSGDPELATCVVGKLAGWKFPDSLTGTYSMRPNFDPGETSLYMAERAVQRQTGTLDSACKGSLAEGASLSGQSLAMTLTVAGGAVTDARITRNTSGDAGFADCAVGLVKGWTFPAYVNAELQVNKSW